MKTSITLQLLLICFSIQSQSLELEQTIMPGEPIASFSIDSEDKVYIGTKQGELYRFLPDGTEDEHFSDIGNSPMTTIEAWNRLKLFIFFRDIQKMTFLDRFTTTPVDYEIRDFQSDLAWLATPGTDNSLWILSIEYNELRKYDLQTKGLITSTPLSINVNKATHMRAFQNLTIIADEAEGLYFFDQYGNYLQQVPIKGIRHFHFREGRLVALTDVGIISLDPFTPDQRITKTKVPAVGAFIAILVSENRYFFIQENKISIFREL